MITSQKELKSRIFAIKQNMSNKDIFLSDVYNTFLCEQKDGVTSFKTTGRSKVYEGNDEVAYTDGYDTYINFNSDLTQDLTTTEMHYLFCGLNLHECGHLLFTDFDLSRTCTKKLLDGTLYPAPLKNDYEDELNTFIAKHGSYSFLELYHDLDNCIEDGFVDRAVIKAVPGYGTCLRFVNKIACKKCEYRTTYEQMKADKCNDIAIFINLVLNYARHGDIFIEEVSKQDELVQSFEEVVPFITKAVFEVSPFQRKKLVNTVFCYLFHFVKEEYDKQQNSQQNASNSANQNQEQSQPGQSSSQSNQNNNSQQTSSTQQGNNSQSSSSNQQTSNTNASGTEHKSDSNSSCSLEELLQELGKATEKTEKTERKGETTAPNQQVLQELSKKENPSAKNESSTAPETSTELETLKNVFAESKAQAEQENEISKGLQSNVTAFLDGEQAHKGIQCRISRQEINSSAQEAYNRKHRELDSIVKRFVTDFLREIKDRQLGDNLTGLYYGKRFEARESFRYDKRYFSRKIAPEDIPDMAVGILIDNSGSMSGERIERSIECAYITYEFCKKLSIPCFIMGHTTSGAQVKMISVADESSIDGKDAIRIFGMHAQNSNRDGYALRYCLKKLERIPANDRIMMIISDGRPNHDGYGTMSGKEDCQKCVKEFLKKGIVTIAASIGDPSGVKYVYKSDISDRNSAVFMDLTDLKRLPKAFIKVIKEKLQ